VLVVVMASGCLRLLAGLLILIGVCMCCAIPSESGARGWATGVIISLVLCFVAFVGVILFAIAQGMGGVGGGVDEAVVLVGVGVIYLIALAGGLFFTLLLRAAARFWGDLILGSHFVVCFVASLVLGVVVVGAVIALAGGAALLGPGAFGAAAPVAIVGTCGVLVVVLALTVWFLTLLNRLRLLIPVR
jgi:hypothetical protein